VADVVIDEGTKAGARAGRRLRDEIVAWLTTVSPEGQPQSSPVWFLWDGGDEIWMLSRSDTPRVRNIAANPHVALNLDGDGRGGNVVSLEGEARIVERITPSDHVPPAYQAKYAAKLADHGWTIASMLVDYPVTIRMTITRERIW
jgi:PPOX class probable F420-dependent enzyme